MVDDPKKLSCAFLILIFLLFGCRENAGEKNINYKITKVTVALPGNGCESGCPVVVERISDDLSLEYFGGEYAKRKGYFKGKIKQEIWDSIQTKFNKFLEGGIDSTGFKKTDHPETEFIIYEGNKENGFIINTGSLSDRDKKTLYWFTKNIVEMTNLQKVIVLISA